MKTLAVCLCLLLYSSPSFAEWDGEDTIREALWQTINLVDWGQTLDIANRCDTTPIHERNPFLRRCPSHSEVNKHFITGALLHLGASYVLPRKYRVGFQWVTIGFGISIINSNAKLGLKASF
jgi:hypothetical protein